MLRSFPSSRPDDSTGSSATVSGRSTEWTRESDDGEATYTHHFCPECGSTNVEWFTASGRATLYSYVINHRPARGFEAEAPYAIAVVELAEGPRMMTNIIGIPNTPEDLVLDMELQVEFEQRGDISVPVFGPPAGEKTS